MWKKIIITCIGHRGRIQSQCSGGEGEEIFCTKFLILITDCKVNHEGTPLQAARGLLNEEGGTFVFENVRWRHSRYLNPTVTPSSLKYIYQYPDCILFSVGFPLTLIKFTAERPANILSNFPGTDVKNTVHLP